MKRVIKVKLQPEPAVFDSLMRTLSVCNDAANWASAQAHQLPSRNKRVLQPLVYAGLKARGLSAQPALLVISKVAGAYATLKANLNNGNYGRKGSERRAKVEAQPISFRERSSQPFDDRCLSWQHTNHTVSIWTVDGRIRNIPYTGAPHQLEILHQHRKGETDLLFQDGSFYLVAVVDEPTAEVLTPTGVIGVDLGIVNIATTSTGQNWSGGAVTEKRTKHQRLRKELQSTGTKSAKRRLKKRSKKESRFSTDTNHVVSKKIVVEAQRTGQGIALEMLKGIRERARLRKPQRVALHSWAFAQLASFIVYKAERAGVPVVFVDPAYTSQQCSAPECGHIEKRNRPNQAEFTCRKCGTSLGADLNASYNIRARGNDLWAVISCPSTKAA